MTRYFPSEWAAQSAIQFTFPHENSDWASMLDEVEPCFIRLIEAVSRYQKVLVVCKNAPKVAELLRGAMPEGTNGERHEIQLVELPSNDTWARDHAAITVFEDEKPVLIDCVFNGWGLKFAADQDNQINQRLFESNILS